MVFAHCDGTHWTLHDHDLTGPTLSVRTWNSLPTDARVDISHQLAITAGLRRLMHTGTSVDGHIDAGAAVSEAGELACVTCAADDFIRKSTHSCYRSVTP